MGDCGEANLFAVGYKENMLVDKKTVDCQFHLSVELDKLTGDFPDALDSSLGI